MSRYVRRATHVQQCNVHKMFRLDTHIQVRGNPYAQTPQASGELSCML